MRGSFDYLVESAVEELAIPSFAEDNRKVGSGYLVHASRVQRYSIRRRVWLREEHVGISGLLSNDAEVPCSCPDIALHISVPSSVAC